MLTFSGQENGSGDLRMMVLTNGMVTIASLRLTTGYDAGPEVRRPLAYEDGSRTNCADGGQDGPLRNTHLPQADNSEMERSLKSGV